MLKSILKIGLLFGLICTLDLLNAQIVVAGFVTNKETKIGISAKIKIKRSSTGKIVAITRSSKNSGSYFTRVKPGDYEMEITSNGYLMHREKLDLSQVFQKRSIYKNIELSIEPKENINTKAEDDKNESFIIEDSLKSQKRRIGFMFSVKHKVFLEDPTLDYGNEFKQFMSYITGVEIALDSLKKKGFQIEMIILDNERDSAKTAEIIKSGALDSLDMLIGPIHNKLFKQTLRYCHTKQILNISPLSVSHLPLLSPYYLMLSPSVETHALELSKWIRKEYVKEHKVLIHEPEPNKYEKDFIRFFSKLPNTDTLTLEKPSPEELKIKLKPDTLNVIMLASSDFSYSYYILSQLSLLEESYRFIIVGMPHWVKFKGIDVDYLCRNNVVISSNIWLENTKKGINTFNNQFMELIGSLPDKYAYQGYDHILALYPLLYMNLKEYLEIEHEGFTNTFKLKGMNRRSKVRRYENRHIKIIQFNKEGLNVLN